MINDIYYKLAYRLQNYRASYLHRLLYLFVNISVIINFTACKSHKTTAYKSETLHENENEESVHLKMSVKGSPLQGNQKTINVIIKVEGKNSEIRLEDFRLKVEFLEEPTFESYINYENAAKQSQIVKCINKPLTEFTELIVIGTASPNKSRSIPIKLNLLQDKQATKLRLGIELLDNQDNLIQRQEVVWRKGKLLVCNLDELIGEIIGNFTLKNTTNIPLDPDKIKLELTATNKVVCQFVKTNSSKATLRQVLSVNNQALAPDTETEPIALQVIGNPEKKETSKITLTITQENSKVRWLPIHIIHWIQNTKSSSSEKRTKKTGFKRQEKAPSNSQKREEIRAANTKDQQKDSIYTDNQEFKPIKKEEARQSQSNNINTPNVLIETKERTTSHQEKQKDSKEQPIIESTSTPDSGTTQVKKNLTVELTKQENTQTCKKVKQATSRKNSHKSISTSKESSPEKELNHTTPKKNVNKLKPKYPTTSQQKETALQKQESKEKVKKDYTTPPNIQLNIKPRTDETKRNLKFWVENKGRKVKKEALNNIKLKYNILEGTGDLTNARLKRGGRADVNEVGMGDLLDSGLKAGQEKSFELIIENGNADSLTINLFLENVQSKKPVIVKWEKEKKSNQPTLLPNIQMGIEPREINEPKFVISLENLGERISKKEVKNIQFRYTIKEGKEDLSNVKLKKGKLIITDGVSLGELLKKPLKKNWPEEIAIEIESANANSLTIKLFLEGIQNKKPVTLKWKKTALKGKKQY